MSDPFNPIPIVRQAEEDKAVLTARINEREKAAVQFTLDHAKAQGEDLLKLKEQAGHGNWMRWVAKNLSIGLRQAEKYMEIAESKFAPRCEFGSLRAVMDFLSKEKEESAPSRPPRNGAIDPAHDGTDCERADPEEEEPADEDKGEAWEPPTSTEEPATTSADDAGTIGRIEAAQKGIRGLGQVTRSLEELKLLAKFRDFIQQIKDALDRHARGKK